MNKLFLLVLISVFSIASNAQTKQNNKPAEVDTLTLSHVPISFTDSDASFLKWKQVPDSFGFSLFNRWGQLVVRTGNPFFVMNRSLETGAELKDGTYFYILKYIDKSGIRHEKTGSITYISTR